MNKFLNNKNISDCCGCSACVQKCPKQCLQMSEDKDGFLIPIIIDGDACIECGLCAKVCPIENIISASEEHEFFGAYNSYNDVIRNSSSGGIYYALAKLVLQKGGVVYGASLNEKHNLRHVCATNEASLRSTMGSKYFQSDIHDTYKDCKSKLDEGKIVLYTGTPCQIQGLKMFLRKDYENLYTADVICHGVPNKKMFYAYVEFLEKKHGGKLIDINFRDKKRNGWSITLKYTIEYSNGKRKDYYLISKLSEYFTAFLSGSIARESCYCCQFSSMTRPGDITMGDFWGYQKKRPDLRHDEGLSLIISNTSRGKSLINLLTEAGIHFDKVDEECVRCSENKNLYRPTVRPEIRDFVYEELEKYGFEYIASKYFRKNQTFKNRVKNALPSFILKTFRKA